MNEQESQRLLEALQNAISSERPNVKREAEDDDQLASFIKTINKHKRRITDEDTSSTPPPLTNEQLQPTPTNTPPATQQSTPPDTQQTTQLYPAEPPAQHTIRKPAKMPNNCFTATDHPWHQDYLANPHKYWMAGKPDDHFINEWRKDIGDWTHFIQMSPSAPSQRCKRCGHLFDKREPEHIIYYNHPNYNKRDTLDCLCTGCTWNVANVYEEFTRAVIMQRKS